MHSYGSVDAVEYPGGFALFGAALSRVSAASETVSRSMLLVVYSLMAAAIRISLASSMASEPTLISYC